MLKSFSKLVIYVLAAALFILLAGCNSASIAPIPSTTSVDAKSKEVISRTITTYLENLQDEINWSSLTLKDKLITLNTVMQREIQVSLDNASQITTLQIIHDTEHITVFDVNSYRHKEPMLSSQAWFLTGAIRYHYSYEGSGSQSGTIGASGEISICVYHNIGCISISGEIGRGFEITYDIYTVTEQREYCVVQTDGDNISGVGSRVCTWRDGISEVKIKNISWSWN